MPQTIAQLFTALNTASSAFATASAAYVPGTPSTVLALASASMSLAGAQGQLARGLDTATAALYEANNRVIRYTQAFADAQAAVAAANPYQVASLQAAADEAFSKMTEAQRQYALVNGISSAPTIGL